MEWDINLKEWKEIHWKGLDLSRWKEERWNEHKTNTIKRTKKGISH